MLVVDLQTNPLDHIPANQRWVVTEGQTRILGPLVADGELLIDENGHLIIEE